MSDPNHRSDKQSTLHVAHLTSVHEALDTRIFYKECCTLAEAGLQVSLVAVHDQDEKRNGVTIVALPRLGSRWRRMLITPLQVLRRALKLKADVYQLHDPELLGIGMVLRATGKRVVYDVHEDVPLTILSKPYLPHLARRPLSYMARTVHKVADRVLSATVVVTPDVGRAFHDPVLVRNYPLLSEFADVGPVYNRRSETCVYIGAISPDRGSLRMREAVAMAQWPEDRRLVLAGPIRDPEMEIEPPTANESDAISYLGVLDRKGIQELLNTARLGIYVPQPTNLGYITAYPIKLFEYMAAGIPVIMSDFPVLREIVDGAGCGLLVDPTDPRALLHAVNWLFDHPDEAQDMGKQGRHAVANKYNFAAEGRRLNSLYQDLCR